MNSFKSNFSVTSTDDVNRQQGNTKIKSELNPSASEFIPEKNSEKIPFIENENKIFDSLEKQFVQNNDWIFYV
jgi:ethanolamine utilization cobalamin adenosyltransferase